MKQLQHQTDITTAEFVKFHQTTIFNWEKKHGINCGEFTVSTLYISDWLQFYQLSFYGDLELNVCYFQFRNTL
jgi:hypothetical protein